MIGNDVTASATFVKQHLGFKEDMLADGFVSLSRQDAGFNLIFIQTGLESFKPSYMRGHRADGLLIAFIVDDVEREYAWLQAEGVWIATTLKTHPWQVKKMRKKSSEV